MSQKRLFDHALALELYRKGHTQREIAKRFGVSENAIWIACAKARQLRAQKMYTTILLDADRQPR